MLTQKMSMVIHLYTRQPAKGIQRAIVRMLLIRQRSNLIRGIITRVRLSYSQQEPDTLT